MAQFPSLPLFTDAYLGDTTHLTTFEHGAYLLLLICQWRSKDDCLPNDDKRLARITGTTINHWRKIKPTMFEFFCVNDEVIFQKRLRDERTHVTRCSKSQSTNSKARWLKTKETTDATASDRDMRNISEVHPPTPTPTKKEKKESKEKKGTGSTDPPEDILQAFELWNNLADELGLPIAQKVDDRQSRFRSRLAENGGIEGWNRALAKIRGSSYLRGEVNGFRANIDFLLQKSSFRKVIEGNYDDAKRPKELF